MVETPCMVVVVPNAGVHHKARLTKQRFTVLGVCVWGVCVNGNLCFVFSLNVDGFVTGVQITKTINSFTKQKTKLTFPSLLIHHQHPCPILSSPDPLSLQQCVVVVVELLSHMQ
jgi:hypothetical protein